MFRVCLLSSKWWNVWLHLTSHSVHWGHSVLLSVIRCTTARSLACLTDPSRSSSFAPHPPGVQWSMPLWACVRKPRPSRFAPPPSGPQWFRSSGIPRDVTRGWRYASLNRSYCNLFSVQRGFFWETASHFLHLFGELKTLIPACRGPCTLLCRFVVFVQSDPRYFFSSFSSCNSVFCCSPQQVLLQMSSLLLLLLFFFSSFYSTHLTRATRGSNGSRWCCWSGRIVISLRCLCVDLLFEVEREVKCCCCCCCSVCLSACQVAAETSLQEFISHPTENYTKAHCKGGFFKLLLFIWHIFQFSY